MLKCFFENKPAINSILGDDQTSGDDDSELNSDEPEAANSDSLEFSKNDWKLIASILEILKPIYESTLFVERRNAHAGHIIPLFKMIEMDLVNEPKTLLFPNVRKAIVEGLKSRIKGKFN